VALRQLCAGPKITIHIGFETQIVRVATQRLNISLKIHIIMKVKKVLIKLGHSYSASVSFVFSWMKLDFWKYKYIRLIIAFFTTRQKFCCVSSLSRNFGLRNPWFIHKACFNGEFVDLNPILILEPLTTPLQISLVYNDVIGFFKESVSHCQVDRL